MSQLMDATLKAVAEQIAQICLELELSFLGAVGQVAEARDNIVTMSLHVSPSAEVTQAMAKNLGPMITDSIEQARGQGSRPVDVDGLN